MDRMTVFGLVFGVGMFALGMYQGHTLATFFNEHAIVLVVGGTAAGLMVSYSYGQMMASLRTAKFVFFPQTLLTKEQVIQMMVSLAEKARRDGIGSLVAEARKYGDPFLINGIQLVADGLPSSTVQEMIEAEFIATRERHKENANFFRVGGIYGPMFGLLGTLIGIVGVLKNLKDDPTSVGPNMAVAITTAFYGIFLANFVCLPVAQKLKLRSDREILLKELMMTGILSIQAGDLPLIVKRRLLAHLSDSQRKGIAG